MTKIEIKKIILSSLKENPNNPRSITDEVWRDIEGFDGFFQVSNLGRVKTIAHIREKIYFRSNKIVKYFYKERIRKLKKLKSHSESFYYQITLKKGDKEETRLVHRLVAKAFIKNPHKKKFINHKNCIKIDNRVENLEWNTDSENKKHGFINNRYPKNHHKKMSEIAMRSVRKLNDKLVKQIKLFKVNHITKECCKQFNLSRSCIQKALYKYNHIKI